MTTLIPDDLPKHVRRDLLADLVPDEVSAEVRPLESPEQRELLDGKLTADAYIESAHQAAESVVKHNLAFRQRRDQAALAVLFAAIGSVIFILIAATLYIAGYDNFALAPAIVSIAIVAVRHLLGALPPRLDGNASKRRASLP